MFGKKIILAVTVVVFLAGCSGMVADEESDVETDSETDTLETALAAEGVADSYERTTDTLDPDETDNFRAAITEADDETPSEAGVSLLERLETVEEVDEEYRDTVAAAVAAEATVEETTLDALDKVIDSPEIVTLAEPLADGGYDDTNIEYLRNAAEIRDNETLKRQAESVGLLDEAVEDGTVSDTDVSELQDSTGDGLLDGKAASLGLDPGEEHPEVAEVAITLTDGEYGSLERDYLKRVAEISEYQGNEYEVWAQAEQLGLLDDAIADGEVSDKEYWKLQNNASNRLLNGMEEEFGSDPEQADTAGDGYPDHLKWGPLRDLGFEVSPDEPDVIVEIDATSRTSLPANSQLDTISNTMATEPEEPVHIHFKQCDNSVDPLDSHEEMDDTVEEHKQLRGIGAHYLLMVDGDINDEEDAGGEAATSRSDHSWMWVDGSHSRSWETMVIAHEIGHSLGLVPDDFDGIDSHEYSITEYNSVMNYNMEDREEVTFSTGDPFDDYAEMADEEYGSWHQPIYELESIWNDGSVDEEIAC